MSDDTTTTTPETTPPEPLPPVSVTLEIPGRLHSYYQTLTTAGLYKSVEEALRYAVLLSYRFDNGSYHNLRLDIGVDDKADTEPAPAAQE